MLLWRGRAGRPATVSPRLLQTCGLWPGPAQGSHDAHEKRRRHRPWPGRLRAQGLQGQVQSGQYNGSAKPCVIKGRDVAQCKAGSIPSTVPQKAGGSHGCNRLRWGTQPQRSGRATGLGPVRSRVPLRPSSRPHVKSFLCEPRGAAAVFQPRHARFISMATLVFSKVGRPGENPRGRAFPRAGLGLACTVAQPPHWAPPEMGKGQQRCAWRALEGDGAGRPHVVGCPECGEMAGIPPDPSSAPQHGIRPGQGHSSRQEPGMG